MIEKVSKLSQPIGPLKQSLLWLMMVLLKFKTVTKFFSTTNNFNSTITL